jgi:hypothetical protein
MGVRRSIAWLLLALLVVVPVAVFASRSLARGDAHGHASGLQHSSRSGAAWRNFATALVADAPRLVLAGDHEASVVDPHAPSFVLVASIFVPPRA